MADQEKDDVTGLNRSPNDTTPLVAMVPDEPYRKGMITSNARTASLQYLAFLERARRDRSKRR
jgi:hypothetical protein